MRNGVAKATAVTLSMRNEAEAVVAAGLQDGDTVMVSDMLRLSDGTPVEIASIQ